MARTEQFTVEEVIAAIRQAHTALGAAHILGCWPETGRAYAKRHPTVARAIAQERIGLRDLSEMSLRGAIMRGEGWAVMGTFKTIDEDGGYIPQNQIAVQHTGEGGGPITLVVEYVNDRKDKTPDAA